MDQFDAKLRASLRTSFVLSVILWVLIFASIGPIAWAALTITHDLLGREQVQLHRLSASGLATDGLSGDDADLIARTIDRRQQLIQRIQARDLAADQTAVVGGPHQLVGIAVRHPGAVAPGFQGQTQPDTPHIGLPDYLQIER